MCRQINKLIWVDKWISIYIDNHTSRLESENHFEVAGSLLDDMGYTAMLQKEKTPEAEGRLENLKKLMHAVISEWAINEYLCTSTSIMYSTVLLLWRVNVQHLVGHIRCVWINMQRMLSPSLAYTGLPKCILGC